MSFRTLPPISDEAIKNEMIRKGSFKHIVEPLKKQQSILKRLTIQNTIVEREAEEKKKLDELTHFDNIEEFVCGVCGFKYIKEDYVKYKRHIMNSHGTPSRLNEMFIIIHRIIFVKKLMKTVNNYLVEFHFYEVRESMKMEHYVVLVNDYQYKLTPNVKVVYYPLTNYIHDFQPVIDTLDIATFENYLLIDNSKLPSYIPCNFVIALCLREWNDLALRRRMIE